MSHIEEGTTTIRLTALAAVIAQGDAAVIAQHPCMALLRQAVTMVAKEQYGVVGTTYADYHYHPQATNTNLALTIADTLPRGIGLFVHPQTGELSFKGDPWKHQTVFAEVQHAIVQHYMVLAYAAALRRMKAQVTTQILQNQVVITGVFHG